MGGQRSDLSALRPPAGMQPLCVDIRTLLLLLLLFWPGAGQFYVIGPRAPVIALVGKEAVLSCQLSPLMDAQNMVVKWYWNDPFGFVHHYSTSPNDTEDQRPEYQGRTEFLKENITKGHVVLRINPIQPSDEGEYACFFESSTKYNNAKFKVVDTVSGMAPHIHTEPGNRNDIKLTCTSTGWYPEPEVQWRNSQGLHMVPASETKTMEENGLFHVESSLIVDKSSRPKLSCVVRNIVLNVEKEVQVSMSGGSFLEDNPWIVWLFVLLILLAISVPICVLFVRVRKSKGKLKKKHDLLTTEKCKLHEELELLTTEKYWVWGRGRAEAISLWSRRPDAGTNPRTLRSSPEWKLSAM